jgi:ATP-dependent Lon protease
MPKIKTDKKYNLRSKKINVDTIKSKPKILESDSESENEIVKSHIKSKRIIIEESDTEPSEAEPSEAEPNELEDEETEESELEDEEETSETEESETETSEAEPEQKPKKSIKSKPNKNLDETVIVTLDATKNPLLNSIFNSLSSLKPKKPAKVVHKVKPKKIPTKVESESEETEDDETDQGDDNEEDQDDEDDDDSTWTESSEIEYNDDEQDYLDNLPQKKREELINKEKEIRKEVKPEVPTRFKILMSDLSDRAKFNIIQRIDHFNNMSPMENEYSKLNQWKNTLDKVPFGKYLSPPISRSDPPSKILNFLHDMRSTLNKAVYGHEEAKTQIIQLMAQQISNPGSIGNCMAIQGPMGNGKTTLVKEGICKALGRPFVFIPLGGLTSAEFLIGHDYTFEGSRPGRIVEMLTECGCMNPVVYFDELDKVSETSKGEEIHNLLIHLTDISQNKEFHDKYFSGIDFDLSKVIFIFSYNDASRINPILLDRMIKIKTEGFKPKDKIRIAKEYLLPRLLETYGFQPGDIAINDETMTEILNKYEEKEEGVRNLRRCLENVVAKVNVYRLIHSVPLNEVNITLEIVDNVMDDKVKLPETLVEPKKDKQQLPIKKSVEREVIDLDLENFTLPFTITTDMLSKLIHKNKEDTSFYGMYS